MSSFQFAVAPSIPLTKPIRIRVRLDDVMLQDVPFEAMKIRVLRGRDVEAQDVGLAFSASDRVKLDNVTCAGGVSMCVRSDGNVRVSGAFITGGDVGVGGGKVKLLDSDVQGNVLDVQSTKPPKIKSSVCGTSGDHSDPPVTWGVCSLD